MRIGIFGGTFNPPHLGHKKIALEMMKIAKLDKIIIIPDNVPPHKISKDLVSGQQRMDMCKLTFFENCFDVSDIELKREGKSYSIYTLEQLKETYVNDDLFLIIGSDMVLSFHQWFRYEDILKLCTLAVMSREKDIQSSVLKEYAENVIKLENDEIIISVAPAFEVSSTHIKEMMKNREDVSAYVEKNTLEYIYNNDLYL